MATEVTVIGQESFEAPKPMEFLYCWENTNEISQPEHIDPSDFFFIELIAKNYFNGFDLMFAYNDPSCRGNGAIFIGHFNNGIVTS